MVVFGAYPVTGQNGSRQNGTDKMAWTKWYNSIFRVDFISVKFNICVVFFQNEALVAGYNFE